MARILVVIDPDETEHYALNRIKELSPEGMQFKVDYYSKHLPPFAGEASGHSAEVDKKKQWLQSLVQPLKDLGYEIETQLIHFTRLYESIIQSASEFNADLIFKPLRQHSSLKQALFTSTDWNLIRVCAYPLLMVSPTGSVKGKAIVAAVDLTTKDEAHRELNKIVLEQSNVLANVLDSNTHLVNAYSMTVMAGEQAVIDPMAYQIYRNKHEENVEEAMGIAKTFNIQSDNVHLLEGAADDVVNTYAREADAGVIVLGTVARSGVSGLFIGNTAEAVLEKTQCDVFVVKQAGFESPVQV